MSESDFTKLELQISNLLRSHKNLSIENALLREKISALTQERTDSSAKNEKAAALLHQILVNLKAELVCHKTPTK